ncbi:MAG: hypothetical protein ACXWQO_15630 [Bdellovibrionota bacterium]
MKHLLLAAVCILSLPSITFAEGVSVRGGANSVGDKLYDDYEQQGVRQLTPNQVFAIIKPLFQKIEKKIPGRSKGNYGVDTYNEYGPSGSEDFLELLSYGISGIKWYLDPKPLDQQNSCQNETVLAVQKVVRACQSDLAVRIDRGFFEGNHDVQASLILHELLTWIKLHKYASEITDEGLREVSRALRNDSMSQSDLQETLKRTGFGWYSTAEEIRASEISSKRFAAACAKDPQYSCGCPGYQKSGTFIFLLGRVGDTEKDKGFGCN